MPAGEACAPHEGGMLTHEGPQTLMSSKGMSPAVHEQQEPQAVA